MNSGDDIDEELAGMTLEDLEDAKQAFLDTYAKINRLILEKKHDPHFWRNISALETEQELIMQIPPTGPFNGSTLFFDAGSGAAVLMQRTGETMRERAKRFATPLAALTWCIKRRFNFVYFTGGEGLNTGNLN